METKKDVSYLGKDFSQIRRNLIEFTKQYFPTTYTDFSEASSGMLLLELSEILSSIVIIIRSTKVVFFSSAMSAAMFFSPFSFRSS